MIRHHLVVLFMSITLGYLIVSGAACVAEQDAPADAPDPDTCSIRATYTDRIVTVELLSAPLPSATLLVLQQSGEIQAVVGQVQFSTRLVSVDLTGVSVRDDLWVVVAANGFPHATCESVVQVNL